MDIELALKVLAAIIALIGSIYKLKEFSPLRKSQLKTDLEIFEKISKNDENFHLVAGHINQQIKEIYSAKSKYPKIHKIGDFIAGMIVLIIFSLLTVYIYINSGFNFWLFVTGFLAIAGLGGVLTGFEDEE